MDTGLDWLMESMDPRHTSNETHRRVDAARNELVVDLAAETDWYRFRDLLCDLLTLIESQVLRVAEPIAAHPDITWNHCLEFLHQDYGQDGGTTAFEVARSGVEEGGLEAVLRNFTARVAEHYAENELRSRVHLWWYNLTTEGRLAAGKEYLTKYAHLIPREMIEGSAVRVRDKLPQVLMEHHRLLQQTRRIGRG